jgi:high-affinity nickel-transport protein
LQVTQSSIRRRIVVIYSVLVAFSIAIWAWALIALNGQPVLLGTAMVAYGLGLRHAVDADHIAAIDNVTRRLMQGGKQPVAVGLFFALGHSSVVLLASASVAFTASFVGAHSAALQHLTATLGTLLSFGFLWLIAIMNLLALRNTWAAFRHVRRGGIYRPEDLDALLVGGGPAARFLRPLFGLMRHSWQMLPLGFLFGLGFETATEVMLLGMSAKQAAQGTSFFSILLFPAMFAAGMTLVDMTDGALMMKVYGWAFIEPARKLYYNVVVTLVSAAVAFLVGGVEALGLINEHFGLTGAFGAIVTGLNSHLMALGYTVVTLFASYWLVSMAVHRLRRAQ